MKLTVWFWFILAQVLVCCFVFRDGLSGGSLLAPIDIAPALYSKYKFVDPTASEVPANHHDVDQLLADLPLQYSMYHSYRRGEIPWWDPYSYSGMPLLADGHSSGTDFLRLLLYRALPFTKAYNWTRIIHIILIGLGMLLLLRRWGVRAWIALPLSVAYEFAGVYVLEFEHPWVESSFLYYPFLWLAWDAYSRQPRFRYTAAGALLVTAIIYSGSIQTHTYLGLFGLAFGFGYCRCNLEDWKRIVPCILISGVVGACLAAPILFNQIELYFGSVRKVAIRSPLIYLSGLGSMTAFYPWALGTFRTLDVGKFIGQNSLGFHPFIGTVGAVLALAGIFLKRPDSKFIEGKRTAILLVAIYLAVLSTPLFNLFYTRCAGLAVMGLVVLASIGAEGLVENPTSYRWGGRAVLAFACAVALITNIVAFVIYPKWVPKVKTLVQQRAESNPSFDYAPALRNFQVENLPNEISFRNPEALLGWFGLMGLGVLLICPSVRKRHAPMMCLLILNVFPVLLFAYRYIPRSKIVLWERLLSGGPEQNRVKAVCHSPYRLHEVALGVHELVFPGALGHLYSVRVTRGWTSLAPRTLFTLPEAQQRFRPLIADWIYESQTRGEAEGSLTRNNNAGLARFQWQGEQSREFSVSDAGLNQINLRFAAGKSGKLLWTDTHYPGWEAELAGKKLPVSFVAPSFSEIDVSESATDLVLRYRPRFLSAGTGTALGGALILAAYGLSVRGRRCGGQAETNRPAAAGY